MLTAEQIERRRQNRNAIVAASFTQEAIFAQLMHLAIERELKPFMGELKQIRRDVCHACYGKPSTQAELTPVSLAKAIQIRMEEHLATLPILE